MEKKQEFHGSDLEKVAEYYHIPKEKIIMFGANINPLGIPKSVKRDLAANLDILSSYPDREYSALKKAISNYCGAKEEHIVVGNGSTEIISLLIREKNARHTVVIGPTYSEYAREIGLNGGKVTYYNLKEENDFQLDPADFLQSLDEDVDFVILCNPNNPTSSVVKNNILKEILKSFKERNIFLMVDETYVEFALHVDTVTAIPLVKEFDNLLVIRGVSKFFAAPGIRLGYGITSDQSFLEQLAIHQDPWSVNSVAAFAGEKILQDKAYFKLTRDLIIKERKNAYLKLTSMKYAKPYRAYGNFIMVKILKDGLTAHDIFEAAIKQGMMIRDCSSFESLDGEFIRFCIMSREDNDKLLRLLKKLLG